MTDLQNLLAGTGVATTQDATAELLDKFGLNWTVSKQPLTLPDGRQSGFYGIVRDDTKAVFATSKAGFEIFQNSEMLNLVNEASGQLGLRLDKAGSFRDGALVHFQIQSTNLDGIGKNKDTVKSWITGMNGHDGSLGIRWGVANETVSCQNSFWRIATALENRVKHTISLRVRISEIMNAISKAQATEKSIYDNFYKFANVGATKENIIDVNKIVLGVDINGGSKDLTTYQQNRMRDLSKSIIAEMSQKGDTLWGLFSGVTRYTTHYTTGGDVARQQAKAIGSTYRADNAVYNQFVSVLQ